jgi:DNA-binding response OmpR family regulator
MFKGRRALVVEDQEMFRDALIFELEMLGFSVSAAKEGEEGYKKATSEVFDFIISDVRMPNWDGRRFLQELRKSSRRLTPFVFMTGFSDLTVQEAYDMGADGFLGKPADVEKLVATLGTLLEPPANRWAKKSDESPMLSLRIQIAGWGSPSFDEQCAIGRGGIALAIDASEATAVKAGERVGFDIAIPDSPVKSLKGSGVVVWRSTSTPARARVGIEFEFLEEPGRSALVEYLSQSTPIAVIPHRQGASAG